MSKIGRQPIIIPEGVTVAHAQGKVTVHGPKGTLERMFPSEVTIREEENSLNVESPNPALWGTWRSHIANMVQGVSQGFVKNLELQGIGYRVQLQGTSLVFQIGFSHPVKVDIPEGLAGEIKDSIISIKGIDKEKVGQFAAHLRTLRPPDAYKGKGIRYQGEVIKLKPGKKAGVGVGA